MNYNYSDFLDLEKVILQLYPDYIDAFKSVLCQTNKAIGHNMFILPWEIFNNYCEWVFSILFLLEDRIDPKDYPVSKIRVFGYMHELLLAIYISKNELRPFYSQITWICDDTAKFKFNRFYYRGAANLNYYVNKLLRKENN
jgi:hypothetical protein